MLKKNAQLFEGFFIASDLLVVSLAWTLSYWVRFSWGIIPVDKGVPPFVDYLRMLIFVWLIWAFVFRKMGLYKPMRGVNRYRELWLVLKANLLAVVVFIAFTYLFREKSVPFSRLVFVIFWFLSTGLTMVSRSVVRTLLRSMRRRGYNLRYALIVGTGELAKKVGERILHHPEYGVDLKGCLTADYNASPGMTLAQVNGRVAGNLRLAPDTAQAMHSLQAGMPQGMNIIGAYSDLGRLVASGGVDQVIVALPLCDHDRIPSVLASLGDTYVDVRLVPDFHDFIQLGSEVEEFDGLPVVSLASTPLSGINRVTKRLFDLVFGTVLLVVSAPVMAVIALLVKFSSRGPVFFSQERVGLDGHTFPIYKFRTMATDAEKHGARFAVKDDPRVTTLGRVLRKLNLDELPQLANVVRGQMSLVGPRPERPVFIKEFRQHIPKYMLRHKVQAGMTGWAQIHGWRGNTSIEKRIEYDLYYIENWSLFLDLKILGLTMINSFHDRNAY